MTLPIQLPPTPPPAELAEAVSAAAAAPDRHELWDEAERLAADLQRPEDVAHAYGDAIHKDLPAEVALGLCERAVAFLGEWFEDGAGVNAVLNRAIAIDSAADWAFRRLTMAHTVDRRWDELMALYDRVIAGTTAPARRAELYGEAAQIAKDLAGRADRAIEYLEALAELSPRDGQITHALERLLEREGRWGELVELWRSHLGDLDHAAAPARRAQIAACLLDRLDSPAEALDEAFHLLADGAPASSVAAVAILERVFAFPTGAATVRNRALGALREHYAASGKTGEIIRVLGVALGSAEPAGRAALHREIAELLVGEGREPEALDHYAELLALDPESEAASARLRALGHKTGRLDRYAAALARAADACGDDPALAGRAVALLSEAAGVRAEEIDDPAGATALYERIFRTSAVDDATMLEVCRRLDGLLPDEAQRPGRLEVLERRAVLEPDATEKRRLRGEAARLADALGDPDRALRSWELCLADDPGDREAHEAVIVVLERERRWEHLIASLVRSADAPGAGDAAREHRVRAAHVHADRLGAPDAAVVAWHEIEELFGQSEETIDALVALLGAAARWDELAAVLEHGLELTLDALRRQSLLQQLGDLYRTNLGAPDRALVCYRAVLAEQPAHAGSRSGLAELLANPACRIEATGLLLQAFEETGDWEGRLSLLEHRLDAAKGAAARTALLLEAADLHEERAGNAAAALRAVARALPLSPDDTAIEARLARLAEATSAWAAAAESLGQAVDACPDAARAAELHFHRGAVLEDRLADAEGALSAYLSALALAEDRLDVAAAAVRAATRTGAWDVAARTVVASARARGASDPGILALVASAADPASWDAATASLAAAVDAAAALPAALAGELLRNVAVWHRDRRSDPAAAEEVLLRALVKMGGPLRSPQAPPIRDAGSIDTLEMLAGVQRRAPGRPLVDTLLALADAGQSTLASLHEAARVAVDVLGDAVLSRVILERLLGEVSAQLGEGESEGLGELASFAIVKLVRLSEAEGDHDRAVRILVDAAALPLGAEAARARLHEAAVIAEERMGDADRAVALYRRVLADSPGDALAIARLSAIFETKGSIEDLLSLRRHELGLVTETSAKIALRLAIAALLGRAGEGDARLAVLRDNLADEPGHARSLEELAALLEAGARHDDLCTLLEEQAALLEDDGDAARAADLWTRASEIAEGRLQDTGRALDDRRRAAVGRPTAETFDALARLSTARGDHAAAVGWLEKRLAVLDAGASADRIATVARLAEALGGAGRAAEARACLERGLVEAPGAEALRAPLRGLYRAAGAWDALVALLTSHGEAPPRADELREAADVCVKKLGSRERAIPILEAMVALTPSDRPARMALASALRGSGDLDRARGILSGLLEEYGRRRPPERAEVHFQLAQVAAAAGQGAEAKAQLETATSMSTEHPGALRMLAGLYRDVGDLSRAERMFGALLLIAVRQKPGSTSGAEDDPERPARTEVMINLHWILTKLGQQGRADEMLASAFEAARRSEFEAGRLEVALREASDHALYLRALEERLAQPELQGPARAAVLSDMAEVLGGPLDRPEDAFRALLGALELDPGSAPLRERAAGMARRAGTIGRWADVLTGLAEQAEAEGRTTLAAGLFLALGEIQERDLGDAARALDFYQRSERLGAEPIPTWRAVARAAALVGDAGEQIRVLRQLTFNGDAGGDAATQNDDIYRLAELELASATDQTSGLGSLEWALGRDPRWDRAGRMLRAAAEAGGDSSVLSAYERVARSSGDPAMLLDALERAAGAGAAGMEVVREAVDLASAAGDSARAAALLRRAVEIGEANTNGMVEAVWALVRLASAAESAEDWASAVDHLGRAAEFAEPEEAARLCRRAVEIAEEHLHSPARAAEAWERLLSRDRHDREVWQPLLAVYRRLGDEAVLTAKLRDAVECAFDAGWRAELRMERARLLEMTSPDDAAAELDDLLQENEEDDEAAALLTRLYERQGREEDLGSLLERRLSFARGRDDAAAVLALSLRLGEIASRDRPDQAIEVYRAALETAPESVDLLGRLLQLFGGDDRVEDRADVLERMLKLATGREAADRAVALADLRGKLGDEDGAARALELGFHADPSVGPVRERLAALYTGGERWTDLASMLEVEGASLQGASSAARLREAAALFLDRLDRPADAARALTLASERAPDDLALLVDLARCLARAGDARAGRDRVSAALERGVARPHDRVRLLRLRAELSPDDQDHALADLEAAYRIDRPGVARELADCLDRLRAGAGATDQALLLRYIDLLLDLGEGDRARDALGEWITATPNDTLVLTRATELEGFSGRWDSAVQLCERLVELSRGPDKVSAALLLAGACARAGYPLDARTVLEQVLAETPQDARIRDHLRHIYETLGAHRELAALHLTEARLSVDPADRFAGLRRAGSLLLESAGDPAAAIAPLEAARDLRPRDNEVAMLLADAYIHAGKLQEAADFLDTSIQAQKGRRSREVSMMQHRMAQIARAVGDRGNELAWLNAAFESDAQNGEAASSLADVATEFGQLEVAVKALKAITLMKNPKPISRAMAYLRQAMIAQHQGDLRKANMLAKKAQSEDPSLEETQAFLASLSG
jgi:tetratricopeptide (TPR) repeat protein